MPLRFPPAQTARQSVLNIYLRGRAVEDEGRIKAAVEQIPEVLQVLDRGDLDALLASDKLGDLVAEPRRPYGFSTGGPDGDGVAVLHGTTREIEIPLFLGGAGIGRTTPRDPKLVDVAPTVALLGTRPSAQGRVLTESLGAPGAPG